MPYSGSNTRNTAGLGRFVPRAPVLHDAPSHQPREKPVLSKLEHFLVMTDDVDGTRDFYRDVLGFQEGFRPELGFLGHWLYLGDTPAIHIADWTTYTAHSNRLGIPVTKPASGTGPLDHVAFNAEGRNYEALRARLEQNGLAFHPHDSLAIGLRQIFLEDPNGLKLELNFWSR
jgi:catechol 2,3-dioxygenase-like lactoylglutathione lyase family enzyme